MGSGSSYFQGASVATLHSCAGEASFTFPASTRWGSWWRWH